jgi:2,4-dienoyl-CoA reductase-like NADH-dependent reductase (Old Yellow Enzyme family)
VSGEQEIGAERVGIRLSPYGTFNDSTDADPKPLYSYLCAQIRERGIAYVHMVESRVNGAEDLDAASPQVLLPVH